MSDPAAEYFALAGAGARRRPSRRRLAESLQQQALIQTAWLHRKHPVYGVIDAALVAVPNGADCAQRWNDVSGEWDSPNRRRLLAEGLRPGFPDLVLFVARGGYHGLVLEMKSDTGRLSDKQAERRETLAAEGYYWTLARSESAAWAVLCRYIDGAIVRAAV